MSKSSSSKMKMATGILQFAWAELKTMNMAKVKGLYKIVVGYLGMRFFGPKKTTSQQKNIQRKEFQETAYRLSS